MNMDEESEVNSYIKDLLLHLNPMIHIAGSSENTLEMLLYLAEMDPNFHKLELVKNMRRTLRENFSNKIESMVNSYLEDHDEKMRDENAVDQLTAELIKEKDFVDFKLNFEMIMKDSVHEMSAVAENNSSKDSFLGTNDGDDDSLYKVSPVSSNETSLNSSLNQSGFLFLNPLQYNNIAESLRKKQLYENLHNALDLLLTVTPGEPVSQPVWPSIRKSLREYLQTEDDDLFVKSLKFHARLLSSQVHGAVKEGFLNLLESVSGFWLSKKLNQRILLSKHSQISVEDNKILIIMKILVQFLKEFSSAWIRYPPQYVTEMMDSFFSIFSIHVSRKGEDCLSFLDILSLLDPKAFWFHAWTHGHLGRKKTFDSLKSRSSLLSSSLSFCFSYLEKENYFDLVLTSSSLSRGYLDFLKFNHSLEILFCLAKYSDGRELFPIYDFVKKDHISLKKMFQLLVSAVKPIKQTLSSKIILKKFAYFCDSKENICKIFCELGVVDFFIQILSYKPDSNEGHEMKNWYYHLVLEFFFSVNSTSVGHEYLLTGRLLKMTSKTLFAVSGQTPAHKIFTFTKDLITYNHSIPTNIIKLSVALSCHLLQTPLGRNIFLSHPLITDLVLFLQNEFGVEPKNYPSTQLCQTDLKVHFEEHFEYVLEKLVLSHKGLLLMEKNNVLPHVLDLVLPHLAVRGKVTCELLNCIVSSEQGCIALGKNFILKPFWDMLEHILKTENLLQPPPYFEEVNDSLEAALIPLLCISSTHEGMKLLYSKSGLLEEISSFLVNPEEQETEFYSLSLKLLGFSASNLDGILFLETLLNLQETLLKQQKELLTDEGVIVDENSMMRSHILTASYVLKGTKKYRSHPFLIDSELPQKINLVHSLPPHIKEKSDRLVKGTSVKRQSELWRFLNDTRTGLHDSTWLGHCRRAYRAELSANEETKTALLMELVELCLEALLSSPDETITHSPRAQEETGEDLPSPISISFSNNVFCFPPSEPSSPNEEDSNTERERVLVSAFKHEPYPPSSLGIEMMIRYGSELNLIPDNAAQRTNLLKLRIATNTYLLDNKLRRFDWFSTHFYYLTGGSFDKTFSLLRKMRNLKVGLVIWPSLMGSLWTSYDLAPNEYLFSAIIHCTKLILFRDAPTAYLALEDIGGGIIWNLLSEWVNQSFVGVLVWPENLHILLVPLLHGGDYFVYALVSLLLHIHNILTERKSQTQYRNIVHLQTELIGTWKIQDHFTYMDSLSKRFRRNVVEALFQPLA